MLNCKYSFKQLTLGLLISALAVPSLQAGRETERYSTTTKVGLLAAAAVACYALYRYYHRPEVIYDAIPVDGTSSDDDAGDQTGAVPMTNLITAAQVQEAMAQAKDAAQGIVWGEPIIDGADTRPTAPLAPVRPTARPALVAHMTNPAVAKADPVVGAGATQRPVPPTVVVPVPAPSSAGTAVPHLAVPVAVRTGVSAAERQAANTAMFRACRTANLADVSVAVAAGADINAVNKLGYTPLMLAVENGASSTMLQGLINLGAHVTQANHDGQTVFYSLIGKSASLVVTALRIFNIALRAELPALAERREFVLGQRYHGQTLMEHAAVNYNNDNRGSEILDGDRDQVIAALQALL
ncbi:MAG TPA: ankyrin repeat domain-containing protein [Candidatus Babeliales bacterium]|nr:ankyrin repeat domain-containing protein [Candidatus Babeliales bacterium]